MFTGLIELLCPILSIEPIDHSSSGGGGHSITIGNATEILTDCNKGDSIAVNGACLTVTEFTKDSFKVGLAPETLKKTNFGQMKVGDKVNCERAMSGDKRFGGHVVQGHVDTTASIISILPNNNALTLTFRLTSSSSLPSPSSLTSLLIPKGYITIDGASLTLIDVSPPEGGSLSAETEAAGDKNEIVEFSIMLISHTQEIIGLPSKKVGEKVNIEFDVMGKYAVRSKGVEKVELEKMVREIVGKVLEEKQ